jgi:hypothetical protein
MELHCTSMKCCPEISYLRLCLKFIPILNCICKIKRSGLIFGSCHFSIGVSHCVCHHQHRDNLVIVLLGIDFLQCFKHFIWID